PEDTIGAEDRGAYPLGKARPRQGELDPGLAAVRGDGNREIDQLQGLAHALDRGGLAMEGGGGLAVEALQEALRQGRCQMRGDALQYAGDLQAEASGQNGGQVTASIGFLQRR